MSYLFISHSWGPSCPGYGNGPRVEVQKAKSIDCGDSCNTVTFRASNHIGTHFDFPRHFDPNGLGVDDFEAKDFLFSNPLLVWLPDDTHVVDVETVQAALLPNSDSNPLVDLLLIRSGASRYRSDSRFWEQSPSVGSGLAEFIRHTFPLCRCVGFDMISVSSMRNRDLGRKVHREFLCSPERPLLIIEDMNLDGLKDQRIDSIWALPLRLEKADGAPATIVALTKDGRR